MKRHTAQLRGAWHPLRGAEHDEIVTLLETAPVDPASHEEVSGTR